MRKSTSSINVTDIIEMDSIAFPRSYEHFIPFRTTVEGRSCKKATTAANLCVNADKA